MLQRMRDLAVESANATNSSDNAELDQEFQALGKEITRVVSSTKFNGIAVLSGGATSLDFQIGADNAADNVINVAVTDLSASTAITNVTSGAITDATTSKTAMTNIDTALTTINTARSTLGSAQNRFEYTVSNLEITNTNMSAAKGRITDADFATETSNMSKASILQQAGTSMLAQANSQAQQVLTLLK